MFPRHNSIHTECKPILNATLHVFEMQRKTNRSGRQTLLSINNEIASVRMELQKFSVNTDGVTDEKALELYEFLHRTIVQNDGLNCAAAAEEWVNRCVTESRWKEFVNEENVDWAALNEIVAFGNHDGDSSFLALCKSEDNSEDDESSHSTTSTDDEENDECTAR